MTTTPQVATSDQIVDAFLRIPADKRFAHNWGTAGNKRDAALWDVNSETYINGVILTVDQDYVMGYLIEVVDRSSSVLGYHAIVTFHGPLPNGNYRHDSMTYQPNCGTFFERTEAADQYTVSTWALSRIHGMIEAWDER